MATSLMKADAMVYYLYTDHRGVETKFAAVVLEEQDEGLLIRVGRFDVHSKEISTFETVVNQHKLQPRSIPCSYEDELKGLA